MFKIQKIIRNFTFSLILISYFDKNVCISADLSSAADKNTNSSSKPEAGEAQNDLSAAAESENKKNDEKSDQTKSQQSNQKTIEKEPASIPDIIKKIAPSTAKLPGASIAVEVNKDAITNDDIEKRLALVLLSSNQTVEMEKKIIDDLIQQVKEALIHEKLQRQIASRLKISISKNELDEAIKGIAKENNMTLEEMDKFFTSKGIHIKTLRDRVEASMLWIKSVREGIGAFTNVSDREVENEEKKMQQNQNKEQYEIAEIVLFVDSPEKRAHIQNEAENLHRQLVDGTPFTSLARNFSQSPSSSQGGLVGWITKEQLPEEVSKIPLGQFSRPILRGNRYIIYFIKDHKLPGQTAASEAKISYLDVKIILPTQVSEDDQQRIGRFLENAPILEGCKALKESARNSNIDIEEAKDVPTALVPDGIRKLVFEKGKGRATEAVRISETELRLFMLCDQKAPEKKAPPTRDEIKNSLREKRIQEQAVTQFNKIKAQSTIVYRTAR